MAGDSQDSHRSGHLLVEEEVTVSIPLVRPKPAFLDLLHHSGAAGEVFTKKEICFHLKNYIGSRKLYDVQDPRVVYCAKDRLGDVFGVEKFTIHDVLDLLSKHCTPLPDTCIKRKQRLVKPKLHASRNSTVQQERAKPKVNNEEDIIGTSFRKTDRPPKRRKPPKRKGNRNNMYSTSTSSADSSGPVQTHRTSISVTYSGDSETDVYPWYFQVKMETSDESEVLSVQDKETVQVQDSTDDLWFVEEDSISLEYESDAFSIEYEVDSSSVASKNSQTEETSDVSRKLQDIPVVSEDNDKEFWADSSATDSESDVELSEEDKWMCAECSEKNPAYQRYCHRCWKLRPDWLPEKLTMTAVNKSGLSSASSRCGMVTNNHAQQTKDTDSNFSETGSKFLKIYSDAKETLGNSVRLDDPDLNKYPCDSGISLSSSTSSSIENQRSQVSETNVLSDGIVLFTDEVDKAVTATTKSYMSECVKSQSYFHQMTILSDKKQSVSLGHGSVNETIDPSKLLQSDVCILCFSKSKTGSIIHGNSGHQVCCYKCAKQLKRHGKACPVCRRPIQKVIKNYVL